MIARLLREQRERRAASEQLRARSWLFQHRLPQDEETLHLVTERLAARNNGRWIDGLLGVALLAAYAVWLFTGGLDRLPAWTSSAIPFGAVMALSLVRRGVLWRRADRAVAAAAPGRVANLDRPSWGELVGRPTLALLALLTVGGWVLAATADPTSGTDERVSWAVLVTLGALYCAALLELARRRGIVAQDRVTLVADHRLRVGEAVEAVGIGGVFLVIGATTTTDSWTALAIVLGVYLLAGLTAQRHSTAVKRAGIPALEVAR